MDNNKYVFGNFIPKYKTWLIYAAIIMTVVVFVVYCIVNMPQILLVIPICFLCGYIFYYKLPTSDSIYYKKIIVDNSSSELKFIKNNKLEDVFKYKDIKSINTRAKWEPLNRRSMIYLDIELKDGNIRNVQFTNLEFGLSFLKKLPESVSIGKLPNANGIILLYLLIVCILAILISGFYGIVSNYTG